MSLIVCLEVVCVMLCASSVFACLTWSLDVSHSDRYTIGALMARGSEYGRVQMFAKAHPDDIDTT